MRRVERAESTPPGVPPEEPLAEKAPVDEGASEPLGTALPMQFAAEPPRLLSRPVPVFPDWADFDEIIGAVARFRVWIDAEGQVSRVELIDASAKAVVDPVREALLASRYTPVITPEGFPVPVSFVETVRF